MTSAPTTPVQNHGLDASSSDEDMTPAPTTPVKTHGLNAASYDEDAIVTSDEDVIVPRVRSRRAIAIMDSDSDDEPDVVAPIRRSTRGKDVQTKVAAQAELHWYAAPSFHSVECGEVVHRLEETG